MLLLVLVGMGEGGGDVDRFYESVGGVSRATGRGDVKGKRGGDGVRSNPEEERPEPIPGDGTALQGWKGNVHIPWWHFKVLDEHELARVEIYIGPRELVVDGMVRVEVEEGEVPRELLGL